MVKCLILDDEALASEVIAGFLEPLSGFELVKTCDNSLDTFNFLQDNPVDLVFLDINMPGMSGLELLKSLSNPPMIIITTAYREYAVEGFALNVLDYLVKPISPQRFISAIDKVVKLTKSESLNHASYYSEQPKEHLFIKVDKRMIKIFLKDIMYIESLKDYIRLKTVNGTFITHQTLTGITDALPDTRFARIHRSYTIALDLVEAIDGNMIIIEGKLLPIGRNYIQEVKELILNRGIRGST